MRKEDMLKNGITILRKTNNPVRATTTFDIIDGIYQIRIPQELLRDLPIFMLALSRRFVDIKVTYHNGHDFMTIHGVCPFESLSLSDLADILKDILKDIGIIYACWLNAIPETPCDRQKMLFSIPVDRILRYIIPIEYKKITPRQWYIYFPSRCPCPLAHFENERVKVDVWYGEKPHLEVNTIDEDELCSSEIEELIINTVSKFGWKLLYSDSCRLSKTMPATYFNVLFIDANEEEINNATLALSGLWEYYKTTNKIKAGDLSCQINELCSTDDAAPKHYTDILQADLVVTGEKYSNNWLSEYICEHQIPRATADQITRSPNVIWFSDIFAKKTGTHMDEESK